MTYTTGNGPYDNEKPATCEWSDCKSKPKISVILDGEKYWFCGHDHADDFAAYIQSSGNY